MRTYNYSKREIGFLSELLFQDIKDAELRKRRGENMGNKLWVRLMRDLDESFDLTDIEGGICIERAAIMYEEDPELVDPRYRYALEG